MKTLNLTQHNATPEQLADGVVEPEKKDLVKFALTFDNPPTYEEMQERAQALVRTWLIERERYGPELNSAMIGGADYFMPVLAEQLREVGAEPLYSFTRREVIEKANPETGEIQKTAIFVHQGFVPAPEVKTEGNEIIEPKDEHIIINLTQHQLTPEQTRNTNVAQVDETTRNTLSKLGIFDQLPTQQQIKERAEMVAELAAKLAAQNPEKTPLALISGPPYYTPVLARTLAEKDILPVASFSQRVSVEKTRSDGSVEKTTVFKHLTYLSYPVENARSLVRTEPSAPERTVQQDQAPVLQRG